MLETVVDQDEVIAIIVYKNYHNDGINFITPEGFPLQLGYMSRPAGYEIKPHIHNPVRRLTTGTQEVLFVKKGAIRIDLYSFDQAYLESKELSEGDFVFLAGAGHGITILEAAIMVEVKNGPYIAEADKGRFEAKREDLDVISESATS